jgi:hypothetical protein
MMSGKIWSVILAEEFLSEFEALPLAVRRSMAARSALLEQFGPELGRPYVDTLAGSTVANLKEFRFGAAGGVWRVAFAFDPERAAIILVAGDKAGMNERRFYSNLIEVAEQRFARHIKKLRG